jgi:hypothetical protein
MRTYIAHDMVGDVAIQFFQYTIVHTISL